ncbi:DNA N6-methyl methyltransferase [Colias croceus]|uniref:DNA N6-methyl methyltransferase n=1 Tax=Colias crocea TaxID=72248 RepID=UPI001E27BA7F|nr:DNA N6-methyl methyltransferase [Colias croceus]
MSILFHKDNLRFIDHRDFISNIYKNVDSENLNNSGDTSFSISPKLFSIKCDKKESDSRKRKHNDALIEEAIKIRTMYSNLVNILPADIKMKLKSKYDLLETAAVRDLSQQLFQSTAIDYQGMSGGNNSDKPLIRKIKDNDYLIPEKCRFLCGCVKEQCKKLSGNKYDIVIADPPWWNKYIRRLKTANDKMGYSMMYNEDIASIPISQLLSETSLIAVWCTNAPSNIKAIRDTIFPKWGVEYITTWYWMKVSIDLEPICAFGSGSKKQPYERIIIGKVGNVNVPEDLLISSVPSALHSHKPPLLDLLSPHIPTTEPKVLELFARYLLPNTTSVGYEPLKWQHLSLYDVT